MSQIDDADRHEIYLSRLTTQLLNSHIYPSLEAAYKAARALLLDAESIDSIIVMKKLQREIGKAAAEELRKGWDEATVGLEEMAAYEAGYSAKLTGAEIGAALSVPAAEKVKSFIDRSVITLTSGSRVSSGAWAEFVNGSIDSAVRQYNGIIASGYQNGQTVGQMARSIRDSSQGLLRGQAEVLARTGQSHYANQAREAMAIDNRSVIKYRVFIATFDNRTTVQCFPAETKVSAFGFIKNIFRSKYTGEAITIRTASGKELTGTPNHPILTSAGFLPLGEIDPSKHVVYSPLVDNVPLPCAQDVCVESTIGELFDSFNEPSISSIVSKSSSTADFYGDGFGGNDKVDIVSPNSELRYHIETVFDKNFGNSALGRVLNKSPFARGCLFLKHFLCWRPIAKASEVAPSGFKVWVKEAFRPSSFGKYFRWSVSCIKHFNSFFSVADHSIVSDSPWEGFHDPVSLKQGSNSGGSCVVMLSNFSSGKPIPVLIDNIVSVQRKFIDSHVYTLESDNGIYIAGGLIVKNCRSLSGKAYEITDDNYPRLPLHFGERSIYVYTNDPDKLKQGTKAAVGGKAGVEINPNRKLKYRGRKDNDIFKPGQIDAGETMDQWMRRQPDWFIEDSLGPKRAQLFKEGGLSLDRFADAAGQPLTLAELKERDAAAFKRAGL